MCLWSKTPANINSRFLSLPHCRLSTVFFPPLQILREKAEFRNPDEFYFGMQNARTAEGIHLASSSDTYTQEQILLMKTQDKKYIEMKAQTERKVRTFDPSESLFT